MESSGYLDPLNEVDLYCLHYIFKPRISKCIIEFVGSWNNHSLSSEGNLSPSQLFFEGSTVNGTLNPVSVPLHTNIDVNADDHVAVPHFRFVPCNSLLPAINDVNPLQHCPNHGISVFQALIHVVGQHLLLNCSNCTV